MTDSEISLEKWKQGDFFLCDDSFVVFLQKSGSTDNEDTSEIQTFQQEVPIIGCHLALDKCPKGYAVISQTCDVQQRLSTQPFVELAPLVERTAEEIEAIRKQKTYCEAYIPAAAKKGLVIDLDKTIIAEKKWIATLEPIVGCANYQEEKALAEILGLKRSRFAFPDEFEIDVNNLKRRIIREAKKADTRLSKIFNRAREVRIRAENGWGADNVSLIWYFIFDAKSAVPDEDEYSALTNFILKHFKSDKFGQNNVKTVALDQMNAQAYVNSDRFNYFDQLSIPTP